MRVTQGKKEQQPPTLVIFLSQRVFSVAVAPLQSLRFRSSTSFTIKTLNVSLTLR